MIPSEPADVARFMAQYEAIVPLLAACATLVEQLLLVAGLGAAVWLHPRWRVWTRPLARLWTVPVLLLLATGLFFVVCDRIFVIKYRGEVTHTLSRRLLAFVLVLPGAMACLHLRRRFWPHDPALAAAGREPALLREALRERNGRAIRHGLIVGLLLTLVSYVVLLGVNNSPHFDGIWYGKVLERYPSDFIILYFFATTFTAVIREEMLWRLVGQTLLILAFARVLRRREAAWMAILVTSACWTLSHEYSFQFAWGKFLQIFPLGLILGWTMEKRGVTTCIVAHLVLNALLFVHGTAGGKFPPHLVSFDDTYQLLDLWEVRVREDFERFGQHNPPTLEELTGQLGTPPPPLRGKLYSQIRRLHAADRPPKTPKPYTRE